MKATAMIVTVTACMMSIVGICEAKNRISIGVYINSHVVAMENYGKAKTDLFDNYMSDMRFISQSIGASTLVREYKVYYPKSLSGIGLTGSYALSPRFLLLARVGSESIKKTDSLSYRDSAGNYLNISYDWQMSASDTGVGIGSIIPGFPGSRNDTNVYLYTGYYSLQYKEKGIFSGSLIPAGGSSLTTPISTESTFSKLYLEPGAAFNFYLTRSKSFGITAAVSYFIIGSDTVGGVVYDVSGLKYGLSLNYGFK